MSKVYLVNVGANTSERSKARCPLFKNGSFRFVPYSYKEKGMDGYTSYPKAVRPFVQNTHDSLPHCDPDWSNLTYGDDCRTPRARSLTHVVENDILLFWALLWVNKGSTWAEFTGERQWCLIGALRVREILRPGQRASNANASRVARAEKNAHFWRKKLQPGDYVFLGCTKRSKLFPKAVDLQVTNRKGLLYRTIRTAQGAMLTPNIKPRWNSSLRTIRAIWDLSVPAERVRAEAARDAIFGQTGYDLLKEL